MWQISDDDCGLWKNSNHHTYLPRINRKRQVEYVCLSLPRAAEINTQGPTLSTLRASSDVLSGRCSLFVANLLNSDGTQANQGQ